MANCLWRPNQLYTVGIFRMLPVNNPAYIYYCFATESMLLESNWKNRRDTIIKFGKMLQL